MELKKTILTCITSLICVIAICVSSSSGIGKICDAKVEAAKLSGSGAAGGDAVEEFDPNAPLDGDGSGDNSGADVQNPDDSTPDASEPDASTPDASTPDASTPNSSDKNNGGNKTPSKTNPTSKKPNTAAEVVKYFNDATSKAVSAKVGFTKARNTDNENFKAGALLNQFKGMIYKFMGIGADNKYSKTVEKGKWEDVGFLAASKLTTNDLSAAPSCTVSGSNYVITLKLKGASTSANKSNPETAPNSALDRSGICVGTKDKDYFDHKTASVIYSAIGGTFSGAVVDESYSNATVKAVINSTTGQIVSINYDWNIAVKLDKVAGSSANASGTSHVAYSSFKY